MIMTMERLREAREAARILLEGVGLRNYRFDVEPREQVYEVLIEREQEGTWRESRLSETPDDLLSVLEDEAARETLVARWRARLRSERAA